MELPFVSGGAQHDGLVGSLQRGPGGGEHQDPAGVGGDVADVRQGRGRAAGERQNCRYAMAGLTLLGTLNQRDWPPAQRALGTLLLLYQLGEFQRIDDLVPGCQGDLLGTGSGPGPLRT